MKEGWSKWRWPRADSAPEQMLLVAEAALHCNNGLSFGRTGLCTWQGIRSPELGFLLLPHASAFLVGSAELPLPELTGGTVHTRPRASAVYHQPRGRMRFPQNLGAAGRGGACKQCHQTRACPCSVTGGAWTQGALLGGWGPLQITAVIVILEHRHREPP